MTARPDPGEARATSPAGFDLDRFLAVPRVGSLHLSPDGRRLVATVQTVGADAKRFAGALWELDPEGERPPLRLTRSARGETAHGFLPDGSVVFSSVRPDPAAAEAAEPDAPALWLLPAGGGEARRLLAPAAGVERGAIAAAAPVVVAVVPAHPGTIGLEADRARDRERADAGVAAVLIEDYPMRWWDHQLGPRQPRLLALRLDGTGGDPAVDDLSPEPSWGGWLEDADMAVRPDGGQVVTGARGRGPRSIQADLVALDCPGGGCRVLASADGDHGLAAWSPDGRLVATVLSEWGAPDRPSRHRLRLVDARDGGSRELAPDLDLWPTALAWAPDGSALFLTADQDGRAPVFRVDLDGGVTRLSADGAFSQLCPAPDGRRLYALRSHIDSPPRAVVLDTTAADQVPRPLPTPGQPVEVPSRLEERWATTAAGARVHSWLVLPAQAGPERRAPLVVFIHGGPFASQAGWHWRWNPHLFTARGYAVLLPDPALSTGYGQAHIDRSWADWAEQPCADLLAAVDDAVGHPDVDADRVAAMGGSYGGYMANWLAGHTDRFAALVSHAGVWALDQMHGTTDFGPWIERELGDPYADPDAWLRQSPHRSVARIRTPMLIIHGERDVRVPISEAIRLWTDLRLHDVPSRFLSFPDENHWILKPQNSRIWYETVLAFLDHHVLGLPFVRPALL